MTSENPAATSNPDSTAASAEPTSREAPHHIPVPEPPPVEQQREDVAATVDALLAKANVSARAKEAAKHQKETIEQNWQPIAAGVAVAAVVLVTAVVLRRRGQGTWS